ncbi:regulator of chromosome condensation [Anaeramoeba flamelloides]|uniref:Regulator of chromosome condensation n=1 Tax=Anaeramoeba flamelloides TaxID=1746091 RepID=A0AAV7ZBI3_9EUKA|nr:regulator of chromosome condensation [Anaeramoeba flamelloides]
MKTKKCDVLINGSSKLSFLAGTTQKLPKLTEIYKIQKPLKIVHGSYDHVLVWYPHNKFELHHKTEGIKKLQLKNESTKDVKACSCSYLILAKSGRIYSLGKQNTYHNIPLQDFAKSNWETLRLVTFFTDKNILIKNFSMGYCNNYFVTTNNDLYASGNNAEGRMGQEGNSDQQLPIFIRKDVEKTFSGPHGLALFAITTDKQLLACGNNSAHKLSLGPNSESHSKLLQQVKCEGFEVTDIVNIITGQSHSTLFTKQGKIFSCGSSNYSGHVQSKSYFTEIPEFKNKTIIKFNGGENQSIALTKELELFVWGSATTIFNQSNTLRRPVKVDLGDFPITKKLKFTCGSSNTFFYNDIENSLYEEFETFFEKKQYTDCVLGLNNNQVKCHKLILQLRTSNTEIETIQSLFEEKTKKEINHFLKYIYYDEINDENSLKEIFNSLDLEFSPEENSLENDLLKLFNDEDSKDFTILIQEDDNDDNDNDNDDDDEYFEEIPVHKLILLIRSGLFREMFGNLNEKEKNLNKIKDYSGKSIESLEILIQYFYTNEIKLTADHDPILVIEELSDAIEYYQLSEDSDLLEQLQNIKTVN